MVQVELSKIIIDEKRQDQIIVLKEKDGNRQFPIVIGFLEASSIKIKIFLLRAKDKIAQEPSYQMNGQLFGFSNIPNNF